ncbi:hypothetical protein BDY21DRAFT_117387 [Lineolata rhizophorae]|uniref:Uncharacterized protein n=1 Tax=Lineolata rhizophorae TaxID=578093 RepID=A0A6A6NPS6_9PEZI|nr:hypothetical protein BDY21DRAFT_117387 [Lineolata rhizophorae]
MLMEVGKEKSPLIAGSSVPLRGPIRASPTVSDRMWYPAIGAGKNRSTARSPDPKVYEIQSRVLNRTGKDPTYSAHSSRSRSIRCGRAASTLPMPLLRSSGPAAKADTSPDAIVVRLPMMFNARRTATTREPRTLGPQSGQSHASTARSGHRPAALRKSDECDGDPCSLAMCLTGL